MAFQHVKVPKPFELFFLHLSLTLLCPLTQLFVLIVSACPLCPVPVIAGFSFPSEALHRLMLQAVLLCFYLMVR